MVLKRCGVNAALNDHARVNIVKFIEPVLIAVAVVRVKIMKYLHKVSLISENMSRG